MTPKQQLLRSYEQAYNRRSWHGTNLRGSIRGVSAARAAKRPGRGRHNIWEIVVHSAYWKYVVWRRITGEPRGSFPLTGSNWFRRPEELSEKAWRADIALLERMHRQLRDAIARLGAREFAKHYDLLTGIVAHDVYHAGQIQLLKRII